MIFALTHFHLSRVSFGYKIRHYRLITARDENFLAIYRASLDTAIEPHHPSERMRPREELRERVKRGTTIPESFIDAWIERACVFDEDGSNGRFVRDIRMTGPMIVPWYMSTMLKPEMLIDRFGSFLKQVKKTNQLIKLTNANTEDYRKRVETRS